MGGETLTQEGVCYKPEECQSKGQKISKRVFDLVTFSKNKCQIVHKMDPELQYVKVYF